MPKDENWIKLGENWIPEKEGDTIIGMVSMPFEIPGINPGTIGHAVIIEQDDGNQKRVILSAGLNSLRFNAGKRVKIVYKGKQDSKVKGHQPFNAFDVYISG